MTGQIASPSAGTKAARQALQKELLRSGMEKGSVNRRLLCVEVQERRFFPLKPQRYHDWLCHWDRRLSAVLAEKWFCSLYGSKMIFTIGLDRIHNDSLSGRTILRVEDVIFGFCIAICNIHCDNGIAVLGCDMIAHGGTKQGVCFMLFQQ